MVFVYADEDMSDTVRWAILLSLFYLPDSAMAEKPFFFFADVTLKYPVLLTILNEEVYILFFSFGTVPSKVV